MTREFLKSGGVRMQVTQRWDGDTEENDPHADADHRMARDFWFILTAAYPGHFWFVEVDSRQGIAKVKIPHFMLPTECYLLHLDKIADPSSLRQTLMRAGGEILERWRIPRSAIDLGTFMAAKDRHVFRTRHDPIPS